MEKVSRRFFIFSCFLYVSLFILQVTPDRPIGVAEVIEVEREVERETGGAIVV